MIESLYVPGCGQEDPGLTIDMTPGRMTVIVGANGAGKSALGHYLNSLSENVSRILAHRRIWFESHGPDVTYQQRTTNRDIEEQTNRYISSRYTDNSQNRSSVLLFDFLGAINATERAVASMLRDEANSERRVGELSEMMVESPLDKLNRVFGTASLRPRISLTDDGTFMANIGSATYPVSQMSDGEKSAFLLTIEVLTRSVDVLVIDEPERHLHRAVSGQLIAAAMVERPDCHFVVLTHDLNLAEHLSESSTTRFVLQACRWEGSSVKGWDLRKVEHEQALPEESRLAILGGRQSILFVEGSDTSHDKAIYAAIYPEHTVVGCGGADEVRRNVAGLRDSDEFHWIDATGLIDGDGLMSEDVVKLKTKHVHVLPLNEVENLYYKQVVMTAVAKSLGEGIHPNADEAVARATKAALECLSDQNILENLAADVALKRIRRSVAASTPTKDNIRAGGEIFSFGVESDYNSVLAQLNSLVAAGDLERILELAPVRDSALPARVAKAMKVSDGRTYQEVVRRSLQNDQPLRDKLRELIGLG